MDRYSRNLAVRALNHWRGYSISTYLGIRLLLDQLPKSTESNYLTNVLRGKIPLRESGRYRTFYRFKNRLPNNEISCRKMIAASPTTALAESYALDLLRRMKEFKNKPFVYSNRWPESPTTGRDYQYFYSWYAKRNSTITDLLKHNKNLVVVSDDIKNFYPSINKDLVLSILAKRISVIPKNEYKEFISLVCQKLMNLNTPGVPVGPALSHVLADLSLGGIDEEMSKIINGKYLRYVDDILLILDTSEKKRIEQRFNTTIISNGFNLNTEKHDCVEISEWMAGLQTQDETEAGIQFEQLIRRISLYLWNKPEEKYSLSKYFNEKGIPFPIQRLASNASYSRFQQYLNLTFIKESHKYKNDNVDIFLSEVEILSNKLFKLAATIKMPIDGNHPLLQKMLTQRLRYQINKLLYVTPIDKYSKILALIPNIPEFYEHKVIIRALITKNIAELIKIPGPATATFASIYLSFSN